MRTRLLQIVAFVAVLLNHQPSFAQPYQARSQVSSSSTSSTDGNIAVFDGTNGHKIKDGGSIAGIGGVPSSRTVNTTTPLGGGGDLSGNLTLTCTTCVTTSRSIATTSPLSGGGDLSADRTLSIQAASGVQNGYLSSANYTLIQNAVPGARTLTTTSPLRIAGAGSADLSADRTLTCPTCMIGPGTSTANTIPRFSGTDGVTQTTSNVTVSNADLIEIPNTAGAGLHHRE